MTCAIVYSSITGNTQIIAKAIKEALDNNSCIYYGKVDELLTQDATVIFVGFWVYRGSCPEEIKKYLKALENKKIVLFGTAGFGESDGYFESIIEDVKQYISESNKVIGNFMCQGKMPQNVLERYQKLLKDQPDDNHILNMIDNYKRALLHPNALDIEAAKVFAQGIAQKL